MSLFIRYRTQLRLGVRISAASLLSFGICHMLGISPSYPAVLTAVVVTQSSVGASVKAMLDRFLGSLGGAVWGVGVLLVIRPYNPTTFAISLALGLIPLAFVAAFKPAYRAAPITAVILLLSPASAGGPFVPAFQRVSGIGLGSIAALGVALLVFPARAHVSLAASAGRAVARMGDLAAILMNGLFGPSDRGAIQSLHDEIRLALAQTEAAGDEAMRERMTYLTGGPDPQPICRALRRLRNDLVMIGRATAEPLPETLRTQMKDSTSEAASVITAFLRASSEAIVSRAHSPSLSGVDEALERHSAVIKELRGAGLMHKLSDEQVGRVFGFEFGLEQLHLDLKDLVDRINEMV